MQGSFCSGVLRPVAELTVIGGGLAGSEAAWQAARRGVHTVLYEMRPKQYTEAHKTGLLGELVCSNSFRSADLLSGPGLLKRELQLGGSLIMEAAETSRVPAGSALAVDRTAFSEYITNAIAHNSYIEVRRQEVTRVPDAACIIATGPLSSRGITEAMGGLIGNSYLYFYDAIAPIVDAQSINHEKVYAASRYGKGGDDYLNCPLTREEYEVFLASLIDADKVQARAFEDEKYFEGCMPVEVLALRGRDTLRFGPMKPVGLPEPRKGTEPYAVVQLRSENNGKTAYNMVGFQTRLKWSEQQRVFQTIPGLEHAEFLRFGSIHRNTFVHSPLFLDRNLSLKTNRCIFLAGQLTGVEGYIESTAMGLVAGINAARALCGKEEADVPDTTAHGSLIRHITTPKGDFQPSNINFGLFPEVGPCKSKEERKRRIVERAITDWEVYVEQVAP